MYILRHRAKQERKIENRSERGRIPPELTEISNIALSQRHTHPGSQSVSHPTGDANEDEDGAVVAAN